ncbi:MAG: hypothetical protein HY866_07440 [Chloroflexi bacterium]|nr:hypothetical protein [Chloroflexota bacterium]
MMYAYPQVTLFKKILYGLLALNLLFGVYVLYRFVFFDIRMIDMIIITISMSVSIFYLVLLITLVSYVEYLDIRMARIQDKLIRLEEGNSVKSPAVSHAGSSSARSGGSMSDRLGKL